MLFETPHAARPKALSPTLTRSSHDRGVDLQSESITVNTDPSCGDYKIFKPRWSEDLEKYCKPRSSRSLSVNMAKQDPMKLHQRYNR